ncbi:hypothetical protein M9435_005352 [Picochlorum sp. BPE23]|nr:hypothetical protein M9435_005352 [Picochlorum sp. BPE23]
MLVNTSESPPSVRRGLGGPGRFSSVDSEYSKEYCIYLWSYYAKYLPRFVRRSILGMEGSLALFPKLRNPTDDCKEETNTNQKKNNDDFGADENAASGNGGPAGRPTGVDTLETAPMSAESFAAVAIIDVTGFTTLTTKASRAGTLGEDVLHRFMNSYFAKVLEMVASYGGDVLHFAGDAMIVVFLPTEDEKKSATMKEDVCYRSVYCIQSIIQKYGCVKITRHGNVEMVDEEEMVGVQLNERLEMEAQAEAVVTCEPDSSVDGDGDDGIESRIQHSLERIQKAFGRKGLWFDQLDIPLRKGVWLPDVMMESPKGHQAVQGSDGPVRLDLRYVGQVLRDAQSRTLEIITRLSGVYHSQQPMEKKDSVLEMLYKGEEYVLQEELSSINQLVYLKGMVSYGDVEFYRVGGNFQDKMESVSEVVMVDKGTLKGSTPSTSGPMREFAEMDQIIRPNQTLIAPRTASLLHGKIFGKHVSRRGMLHVLAVRPPSSMAMTSAMFSDPDLDEEETFLEKMSEESCQQALNALVAHIPTPIKNMTSDDQSSLGMTGSRICSILFFGFPSLNLFTTLDSVQNVFTIVQKHLARNGSAVLQMRNDEKGFALIGGFGLPGHSKHARDSPAEVAVLSAFEILEDLEKEGFRAKVGITTGYVLCTSIGSDLRCEYSVFGDTVNLAARLMVFAIKSHYSIFCDEETQSMCSSGEFNFQALHSIPIKGFLEYKNVFSVEKGVAERLSEDGPTSETPYKHFLQRLDAIFVGRDTYIKKILSHVELLRQGIGSIINITGFSGVGKTALFNHIFQSGQYKDVENLTIKSLCMKESIWKSFQDMINGISIPSKISGGLNKFEKLHAEDIDAFQSMIFESLQMQDDSKSIENLPALLSLAISQGRFDEKTLSGLNSMEQIDIVSEFLMTIVQNYVESEGSFILFIDNIELAPPVIWRLARKLLHKGLPVLFILSLRWSQFIFLNGTNWMEDADSASSRKEPAEEFIGFNYYMHNAPIESIQSPLLQDFFSIVLDDSVTTLVMRDLSEVEVCQFIANAFPGLRIDGRFLHSVLAGHPGCMKLLCIFLFLHHQKRTVHETPVGSLSSLLLYQIRTFSPMWSRSQAQFDLMTPEGRYVGVHFLIMGNVVPEQILIKYCTDLTEEQVRHTLEVLEYVGYLISHESDDGSKYWETKNPVLRQSYLDMIPTSTKRDLRARLAMVFEQMYYDGELRFDLIGWYWRESCRACEGILWRRALRAIAAFEDCACVQLDKGNYALAEENLTSAISLAISLTESSVHAEIKPVPRWRIAAWERSLAACKVMKEYFDAEEVALHCLKAITLLGDPLPWNYTEIANNSHPKVFPKPSKLVASMLALGWPKEGRKQSSITGLANLGNPQWVIIDDGEDQYETIPELVGMTTSFLPSKGKTVADEIEQERTYIVQIFTYIFESSGPWDPSSIDYVSKYCSFISSRSTSQKTISKIRGVKARVAKLAASAQQQTNAVFSLDSAAHPIMTSRPSLNYSDM